MPPSPSFKDSSGADKPARRSDQRRPVLQRLRLTFSGLWLSLRGGRFFSRKRTLLTPPAWCAPILSGPRRTWSGRLGSSASAMRRGLQHRNRAAIESQGLGVKAPGCGGTSARRAISIAASLGSCMASMAFRYSSTARVGLPRWWFRSARFPRPHRARSAVAAGPELSRISSARSYSRSASSRRPCMRSACARLVRAAADARM